MDMYVIMYVCKYIYINVNTTVWSSACLRQVCNPAFHHYHTALPLQQGILGNDMQMSTQCHVLPQKPLMGFGLLFSPPPAQ
ncbi:hypothetical protein FKM82_018162 [Ascaphus truei]